MPRGKTVPAGAETYPEDIYASMPTIAALAKVGQVRFMRMVEAGQVTHTVVTTEPRPPRRIKRLYRLSDVLKAVREEGEVTTITQGQGD